MKKLFIFLFLLSSVSFVGCAKTEAPAPEAPATEEAAPAAEEAPAVEAPATDEAAPEAPAAEEAK
ncbi:hypothetical protein [Chlorobium sp. N1]|uniref:hypothetical protein n=1 Tax=Chlorobium sp. N1 TaxID=2491138 RepID=UPI001038DDE1|nr:hypothetical protein [Chlorobium sp. N1]TCD46980.1 hypothetical protein E0L29_10550 [Chlorobium sp. N1]